MGFEGNSLKAGMDPMYVTHPDHGEAMLNNHSFNQFCGLNTLPFS